MENLSYTKEEIKIFQDALKNAINDLESLWQIKVLEEISVAVSMPGFVKCSEDYTQHNWYLHIDNRGIYLFQGDEDNNRSYWFARRKRNNTLEIYTTINEQDIIFLNNYFEIREKVARRIELALENKKVNLEKAKLITQKYNQSATIEINMPPTNNQHSIEVTEENGKKIGTISFNGISLKIITDANIEFKNRNQNEKMKRK